MKMSIVILFALAAFLATASALKCHKCGYMADDDGTPRMLNCTNTNVKNWKEEECRRDHNASCNKIVLPGNMVYSEYTKLNHFYDKLVF